MPKKEKNKKRKKREIKRNKKKEVKRKPVKKLKPKAVKREVASDSDEIKKTKIKVIGIGGGGGSIISEISEKLSRADFVVANTDRRALKILGRKTKRFQFGESLTYGLGTGMNSDLGKLAAENEKERIKNLLKDQDLCIIVASLGGGTGSGAAPVFAKISRNLGNLTYGIFTLPFKFEGEKKEQIARESLEKLKPYLNAISILPNERIFQIIDKNTPLKEALSAINKNLSASLAGLIEMIYNPGLINIDFADLRTILEGRGRLAYLNTIEFEGPEQLEQAVKEVVANQLYPYNIQGTKGILFNIIGERNLSLASVNQISNNIWELVNPEAKIIFGVSQNRNYKNKIRVTLLAVGCGKRFLTVNKSNKSKRSAIKKSKKRAKKSVIATSKKEKIKEASVSQEPVKETKKRSIGKEFQPPETEKKIKSKTKEKKEGTAKVSGTKTVPDESEAKKSIELSYKTPEKVEVKIRRNGLQIKREMEEAERELLRQEEEWETPAFLRKANIKDSNQ